MKRDRVNSDSGRENIGKKQKDDKPLPVIGIAPDSACDISSDNAGACGASSNQMFQTPQKTTDCHGKRMVAESPFQQYSVSLPDLTPERSASGFATTSILEAQTPGGGFSLGIFSPLRLKARNLVLSPTEKHNIIPKSLPAKHKIATDPSESPASATYASLSGIDFCPGDLPDLKQFSFSPFNAPPSESKNEKLNAGAHDDSSSPFLGGHINLESSSVAGEVTIHGGKSNTRTTPKTRRSSLLGSQRRLNFEASGPFPQDAAVRPLEPDVLPQNLHSNDSVAFSSASASSAIALHRGDEDSQSSNLLKELRATLAPSGVFQEPSSAVTEHPSTVPGAPLACAQGQQPRVIEAAISAAAAVQLHESSPPSLQSLPTPPAPVLPNVQSLVKTLPEAGTKDDHHLALDSVTAAIQNMEPGKLALELLAMINAQKDANQGSAPASPSSYLTLQDASNVATTMDVPALQATLQAHLPQGPDAQEPPTAAMPSKRPPGHKGCNCRSSRCLKLYCDCFKLNLYCSGCNCKNCQNTEEHKETVLATQNQIKQRDPDAFSEKFLPSAGRAQHVKGCNCKKSHCRKKYCECFQAGVLCGDSCKCVNCQNHSKSVQPAQIAQRAQQNMVIA